MPSRLPTTEFNDEGDVDQEEGNYLSPAQLAAAKRQDEARERRVARDRVASGPSITQPLAAVSANSPQSSPRPNRAPSNVVPTDSNASGFQWCSIVYSYLSRCRLLLNVTLRASAALKLLTTTDGKQRRLKLP